MVSSSCIAASVAVPLIFVATSVIAETADNSACRFELAKTWASMEATTARLKSVARAGQDEKCAAYNSHVDVVGRLRDVLARCKSGREREGDLAHMDGALDDVRSVINRDCK